MIATNKQTKKSIYNDLRVFPDSQAALRLVLGQRLVLEQQPMELQVFALVCSRAALCSVCWPPTKRCCTALEQPFNEQLDGAK